ncbi:MAG: GNAT family N-acetyltransferase [Oscillospiraceae bacterium]|jgi:GNAT superfamily N-acetyltransferase|nr:GNAT family N-acetyltransferase [Oscillospiraceae bacterium]
MEFEIKATVAAKQIAELRTAVGWNGMQNCYEKSLKNSYLYVCCFEGDVLIGFLDVISNGVTDAYIQDLMVHPAYQGKGIGTELMTRAIEKLKADRIFAISVLFEERQMHFYEKFGFHMIMAGQMETYSLA